MKGGGGEGNNEGGSLSFIGVIMLVLVVVVLVLRHLWAWGAVWGRGVLLVGMGRRLLPVVVVAVLVLWPARCRALLVTWHCHVVVAVVSVYSVGCELLLTVESGRS